MKVLVTGGAGFIGSHTCKALAAAGHYPVTLDNLSTGHAESVKYGSLICGDLRDFNTVKRVLKETKPDAVIHFAASAYVGASMHEPLIYYRNNVVGTLNLLEAMEESGVGKLIFSSSCATYGEPDTIPIRETEPQVPINPYGNTKLICEQMSRDVCASDPSFHCTALRYFNAAGADRSGEIGEIHDPETHLIPLILLKMLDPGRHFVINGDNYPTPDGTCIRDYLHVEDLAKAHVKAMEKLAPGFRAFNLGSGRGYSVREVIRAAEKMTGHTIDAAIAARRPGDPPVLVADPSLANRELGWTADVSDIDTILLSAWNFLRQARAEEW